MIEGLLISRSSRRVSEVNHLVVHLLEKKRKPTKTKKNGDAGPQKMPIENRRCAQPIAMRVIVQRMPNEIECKFVNFIREDLLFIPQEFGFPNLLFSHVISIVDSGKIGEFNCTYFHDSLRSDV